MLVYEGADARVRTVDAGRVHLDGGAMFGVVPKPLWEKRIAPDDRNRIPLQMRCLLIELPDRRILVDTGIGDKEDDRFERIYGVRNAGDPTRLHDSLDALGLGPEEIDVVVNTHLHFDHAGGNTVRDADGALRPAFPRARYVIRRGEWEFAHRRNERIQASYLAHNVDPLEEAGRVDFVEEDTEVAPGVWVIRTPGHTPWHQSVLLEVGSDVIFYLADLVPTTAHVRLPWIMGYDVEPLVTLETKREILGRAGREEWTLVFEHDPEVFCARARPAEGDGCELTELRREETAGEEESEAGVGGGVGREQGPGEGSAPARRDHATEKGGEG